MSEIWMDVDAALSEVPINVIALTDDGDFKTREESVTFEQAGLDLLWNFVTTAGAFSQTAVTPTDTGGDYDWVNQGNGYYTIEIPASGGASINNDAEGFGFFSGVATGVLPWRGPTIGFRAAALNNALIDGGDVLNVSLTEIGGDAQSATDLKDFADDGYDPATNKVTGVLLVDTSTANSDMRGTDDAATAADLATLDAIVDTLLDALVLQVTTIATLTNQTSFTLAAGSADNDAYNEAKIVVVDQSTGTQKAFGSLSDYTGSTKRVILAQDPGIFTMATGDIVYILPSDSFAILDAVLSGQKHNVTNSLGRRVRQQQEAGTYSLGLVWLDTIEGFVGTTLFENGTEVRPVKTIAEANTILSEVTLGLHGCHVAAGSSISFPGAQENQEWTGEGWTLALNGKSIAGTSIIDAVVSGISLGVPNVLRDCFVNGSTFAGGDFIACALGGVLKLSGATSYHFFDCHHARTAALSEIDFDAAVGAQEVHVHNWHGNLIVKNMKAGDVLHFTSPDGALTLDASCTAGTVNLAGVLGLTNNGSGQTINDIGLGSRATALAVVDANVDQIETAVITNAAGDDIADDIIALKAETVLILEDTDELQSDDIPTLIAALNNITAAAVLAAGDIDGLSLEEALKVALAAMAGKASGLATNTAVYRAIDDSKARITATVDADGNRTAVTIDATG